MRAKFVKMMRSKALGLVLGVLSAVLGVDAQFYYGLHQEFGKNRVEFNTFDWKFYRFENIDVYFYKSSDPIARRVAVMAHQTLSQMEKTLDSPIQDRLSIVVFNNLSDLVQSNLIASNEDAYNTGGVTRLAGNKMHLYFNGSYAHLEQQIKAGMAEVAINNLIYGDFTQSFKNSTLLHFPDWYFEGLMSFLSGPMSAEDEALLIDGFQTGRFKRFNALSGEEARVAGHAIWEYVEATYGRSVIKNVVFMAVVNRNVESGFQYIIGAGLPEILQNLPDYYRARFQWDEKRADLPGNALFKARKDEKITALAMAPDATKAAVVVNRQGRYRVRMIELPKGRKKTVGRGGYRIPQNADYSHPLPVWNPDASVLSWVSEEKGFLWLHFYNLKERKKQKRELFGIEKVLSLRYSADGQRLLMSAVKDGQSDLFEYTVLSTSYDRLTNDAYDDLDPVYLLGEKRVLWRSNRPIDSLKTLPKDHPASVDPAFDLFSMPREADYQGPLWRHLRSPGQDENQLVPLEGSDVAYTAPGNPFRSIYLLKVDSSIAYVDTTVHYAYRFDRFLMTNEREHLLQMEADPQGQYGLGTFYRKGREQLQLIPSPLGYADKAPLLPETAASDTTPAPSTASPWKEAVRLPEPKQRVRPEFDLGNYTFSPGLTDPERSKPGGESAPTKPEVNQVALHVPSMMERPAPNVEEGDSLVLPNRRNYFTSLYQDEFTTQIDNAFSNPQYQPFYGGPSPGLLNAGFNMLFKVGVVDLFNNYRITAGLRTDFQPVAGLSLSPNAEFFIGLQNFKPRLNQELMLYRRSRLGSGVETVTGNTYLVRVLTHEGSFKTTYPFSPVSALQGSLAYRQDRSIVLSTDAISLTIPDQTEDYLILRAAYIYDNTRKLGLNLHEGLRYKVFTEYYRNLNQSQTGLHTLGFDARHYTPVHRTIIWANRLAYGTSFGQQKLVHFMGGVDNEFSPRFNSETPIAQNENYLFQTLVTNLRGFFQNARNGNSFAVFNSELRVPVFRYLLNRPIRNDFIANFQVVGFADVGTAWNGASPWSAENALNTKVVASPPLTIVLDRQKDPILLGTGFGLRTRLLGYFMRADWAWGIEDGQVLPGIFYFSLSTDF